MDLNVEIKGSGYPILCLHGHPGSSQTMSVFTDVLSQRYQTIAPDLRGYGQTKFKKRFEMEEHISDLQQLLRQHQIKECLVLGWSLGGILGLELTMMMPEVVSGVILVASAARPSSDHPKTSFPELLCTGIAGIINYVRPGWQWNINVFGKRSLFQHLIYQQTSEAYQYLGKQGVKAFFQTSISAHQALNKALSKRYNRLEDLVKVTVPCLVLAGQYDRHITAQASAETANYLIQSKYICYPNTAHLFPWEISNLVNQDIQEWLQVLGYNASDTDIDPKNTVE